ncbi:hypothetical protein JIQ42_08171 [Leishmania sp. Namibia]|uniref:hypothetical protein n=1 Tax=Leishmania sp. Namibia TaxID=2802991 RepID=UPI001B3F247F|nr:hypothetical protein JIQ42_08171 [Leishmania sp. Namibia]
MPISLAGGDHAGAEMYETCTYTTVFDSRASHYYAVAPRKPYEKLLSAALSADVAAMIAGSGGGGTCCNVDTPSYGIRAEQRSDRTDAVPPLLRRSGAATAASSTVPPCVCMESVAITDVHKHFHGVPELLGVTFQVNISMWGAALADTRTAPAAIRKKGGNSAQVSVAARDAAVAAAAGLRLGGGDGFARGIDHDGAAAARLAAGDSAAMWRAGARRAREEIRSSAVGRHRTRDLAAAREAVGTNRSSVVVGLSNPPPAAPFVWTLPRGDAFPSVQQHLLKALTRRAYLSAYRNDVHVFGHVTLSDLSAMLSMEALSSSSKSFTAQARAASRAVGSTHSTLGVPGAPVAGAAQRPTLRRAGELMASKRGSADYCRILVMPINSTAAPPGSRSLSMVMTTDGKASYPTELVHVAQGAYSPASGKCANAICITGAVCSLVMVVLIACATLAYAHQLWRRRSDERADERRLLQHDLR